MKINFPECPNCGARPFFVDSDELQDNEGVLECDCGYMLKPAIKTIIYGPTGYYGSKRLWRDASYAFQHRNDYVMPPYGTYAKKNPFSDWEFLGNDKAELTRIFHFESDFLPEHDYEFVELD